MHNAACCQRSRQEVSTGKAMQERSQGMAGCGVPPLCPLWAATREEEQAVSMPLQGPCSPKVYAMRPLWYGAPLPVITCADCRHRKHATYI